MKQQQPSKKIKQAYAALFADSPEYNELHLHFLAQRRANFFRDVL